MDWEFEIDRNSESVYSWSEINSSKGVKSMWNTICSAVAILLSAATFASANVVVKDALVFGDGTKQTTATVQGPVGLQGATGDTGPAGPAGPAGTVSIASMCAAITAADAPLPAFCGPTYTVTSVVSGGNGSITPLGDSQVYGGKTKSFTVTPNSGYTACASGCGGSLTGNSYTTAAITAACTVTASFAPIATGTSITDPTTGMVLIKVTGGTFTMGDTFGDGSTDELPLHQVTVSDFYIGKYEVTQAEWQTVMTGNTNAISATPSFFTTCGTSCPVEQVSWNDIQIFISRLNTQSGKSYRLPTEAEWEYAARSGGQSQKYSGGSDVNSVA